MIFSRLAAVATVAVLLGGAATGVATASPHPHPLVFDGDMDFDDAATLAYLCRAQKQDRVQLRAVTVTNNGDGLPGRALTHVRSELAVCGLDHVPVADGSPCGVHQPTPDTRAWTERVLTGALHDAGRPATPSPVPAWLLLATSILTSPHPVTVVATGPFTNVAKALDVPGVAARIGRVSVMGGAFTVPGNVSAPGADGSQETNIWLDPPSAAKVFAALPGRVDVAGLDATNDVPIRQSFVDSLAAGKTLEAALVHTIMTQPDVAEGIAAGAGYWWDPLAASDVLAPVNPMSLRTARISVVRNGSASGRTEVSAHGTPQHIGTHADLAAFERDYAATLNG